MLSIDAADTGSVVAVGSVAPIAYDTDGAVDASGLGRSTIITAMDTGKLIARKSGRRTVILHDDLIAFLRTLPPRKPARAAAA